MRENGYETAMVSANELHLPADCRLSKAFETYLVIPAQAARLEGIPTFEAINGVVLPWLQGRGGQSFFLYIHAMDTHFPHVLDPPYD